MPDQNLVLVVDDNETSRYTKVRTLRHAGYAVLEAGTGAEGLRLVAERAPRLVVLDIHLPDVDGWEVCRRIKADPATSSTLVLQVSATYVREADTVRSLESGADASLVEPTDPPVLVATVRALLRARKAEDALRDALGREQAARASAEAANRAKDEFLATLSHELRSPLGAILTWITLLRSGSLDEDTVARGLEVIERNTRLQVRMIEELLDVSRIISGKMVLDIGPVDLAEVLDGALESVRPAAEAKGVDVQVRLERGIGPTFGDAARLQQVVWNLLSNAVKFTPEHGRVAVRLDREGTHARIQVRDDGRGIEPEFLPHVFERFRQADASSTRSHGGLGIGLAIVRHLTELHGGTVSVESEGRDRGSCFTVLLPLPSMRAGAGSDPAGRSADDAAGAPLVPLHGVRVLVVDDEEDARDSIASVLRRCGATVLEAGSSQDAITALRRDGAHVIVSDIAMPDTDGYGLIEELRRLPGAHGIPVLALTAFASADEQQRIREAGFDAYLAKPIGAAEIGAAVAELATGRERGAG